MKVMVVSPKNKTLFNFRGDLIKAIINKGNEVVAIGPNRDFIEDVLNLGVRFIEVPFTKDNTSISGDFSSYKSLVTVMSEEKPDLVFSDTCEPVIYSSLGAREAGVLRV